MKPTLHQYYEDLNDTQQACLRWCAEQLFHHELREIMAHATYQNDYDQLSPLLQDNVDGELEKLGTTGPFGSSLLKA